MPLMFSVFPFHGALVALFQRKVRPAASSSRTHALCPCAHVTAAHLCRRNGKPTSLGCFDHEEEASRAYDKMMLWCELHHSTGVKGGITNFDPAEYEADIPWLQSITQVSCSGPALDAWHHTGFSDMPSELGHGSMSHPELRIGKPAFCILGSQPRCALRAPTSHLYADS